MAEAEFRLKQGATFQLSGTAQQEDGAAWDLTGATLSAKLRDAGDTEVATLTAAIVSPSAGTFTLTAGSTAGWPVGVLRGDVRVALPGGNTVFTETFQVRVERPVTR